MSMIREQFVIGLLLGQAVVLINKNSGTGGGEPTALAFLLCLFAIHDLTSSASRLGFNTYFLFVNTISRRFLFCIISDFEKSELPSVCISLSNCAVMFKYIMNHMHYFCQLTLQNILTDLMDALIPDYVLTFVLSTLFDRCVWVTRCKCFLACYWVR